MNRRFNILIIFVVISGAILVGAVATSHSQIEKQTWQKDDKRRLSLITDAAVEELLVKYQS